MKKLIEKLRARRAELARQMEALYEGAIDDKGEERDLTEAETTEFRAKGVEIKELDGRIVELVESIDREAKVNEAAKRVLDAEHAIDEVRGEVKVKVTGEPRTYSLDTARRHRVSFIRDVMNRNSDPRAAGRLARHMQEAEEHELRDVELRDVGTGAFAGLTVPQYLTDLVAPLRRAGRPTANVCRSLPLPADGMTVNISRITTGAATVSQATENAAVVETDMDDTLLTVNVVTIAGMQDVSRQAIDRSTGVDQVVIEDLTRAYNTELNRQIINSAGTGGQHLGIRSTAGIISVIYTDATPTAAELYPAFANAIQQVQSGIFGGLTHWVMHPRRWWWIAKELGTTFPLVQFPGTPAQVAGGVTGSEYEGMQGPWFGLPVIADATIPTNLGGGTNEDVILGITASEEFLWEDASAPLFLRTDEALSLQLSVRFVGFGYSAFTAGRYPAASATISGTGLITPTF